MKINALALLVAAGWLSFASCNKQYDTKVEDSQTNNNGGSGSSGFNWTGTAPMSAKVDGKPWLATAMEVRDAAGYYALYGTAADGSYIIPGIPKNALPGQVFSAPSPANVNWGPGGSASYVLGASPGKIKVTTNDATTIEGYFWADEKDPVGLKDTLIHITEGYFKVTKP